MRPSEKVVVLNMDLSSEGEKTGPPLPTEEDKGLSSLFSGKEPLGFILLANETLCPFGILPAATEADALGDPATWKEVKVPPPTWMWGLQPGKSPLACPADFCGEKIGKNYSFESHLKKHLNLIISQKSNVRLNALADLPSGVPMNYYCNAYNCVYGYSVSDMPRNFTKLKYLKQHYFKVHAPKTFECGSCEKTFSTVGFLEVHKRMCGNSFDCSVCISKYTTLEALQTHCRRKSHHYDYDKYREILNISKQEKQARRAEENLKQKLAAVSLASNPVSIPRKELKQLPICIPRPKTVTTCGPGGATSHVTWTYENGTECLKVKVEMATQTNTDSESPGIIENIGQSAKCRSFSAGSQQGKRKQSAETQTGKLRYKISTETQTANVVKRRRASKKQNAEAETQCTLLEPIVLPAENNESLEPMKTDTTPVYNLMDANTPKQLTGTSSCSQILPSVALEALISLVEIDENSSYETDNMIPEYSEPELTENGNINMEAMISRMNTSTSTVATSEMCVGNRFDEVAQQLFDFEEFNRETQTDPNLFQPSDYILSDFDMEVGEIDPIGNFLNLVTTETQTWPGISPPRVGMTESASSSTSMLQPFEVLPNSQDWNTVQQYPRRLSQTEFSSPFDIPVLSPREGNANSPTFLETMDNETQTSALMEGYGGYDFDALIQNMLDPPH